VRVLETDRAEGARPCRRAHGREDDRAGSDASQQLRSTSSTTKKPHDRSASRARASSSRTSCSLCVLSWTNRSISAIASRRAGSWRRLEPFTYDHRGHNDGWVGARDLVIQRASSSSCGRGGHGMTPPDASGSRPLGLLGKPLTQFEPISTGSSSSAPGIRVAAVTASPMYGGYPWHGSSELKRLRCIGPVAMRHLRQPRAIVARGTSRTSCPGHIQNDVEASV
jgi:hypothetical protein